jgi:hypothetical protein
VSQFSFSFFFFFFNRPTACFEVAKSSWHPKMALASSALSRTLQSITATKISELDKQRKSFEVRKNKIFAAVEGLEDDHYERARRLLLGVKELDPSSKSDMGIWNMYSSLYQSYYDPSIPVQMLQAMENQLRSRLDAQSRRLNLADLYSRLLTEWLVSSASSDGGPTPAMQEIASLEDSFEVIERDRLQQLRDKFSKVVFTPFETDEIEIDNYLSGLFKDDSGARALQRLRDEVKNYGEKAFKAIDPFDQHSIKWCIRGLLKNDLLSEDKKVILQDFLQDEVALGEICDVLNMKYKDLKNWSWDAGDTGMPVEPRRQLNGKYRIMMDEDVLQAVLLHYIGVIFSVAVKGTLTTIMRYGGIWKHQIGVPQEEIDKRQYYLGKHKARYDSWRGVAGRRQDTYGEDFFLSQLPTTVYDGTGGYDGDDEADEKDAKRKSPKEIMQQLLQQLATEIHLRRALDGKVAIVQSDLQWYAAGLPHSTVFAIIRFMGVPEEWIVFFKKFLEAPLNMGHVSPDSTDTPQVRIRKRGVPMAHSLEKFFGEIVLFFMDLAVNQEAEMLLYRFHDDLWLVGEPEKCARAWKTMEQFSAVMGLEFNKRKTGSVYLTDDAKSKDKSIAAILPKGTVSVGFLELNAETGDWSIQHEEVDKHIRQLQKQLLACTSVLAWVQTWNSCIGRFFSHTFGEPANCFGRKHLESILKTHKRMQELLFDGKDGNGKTVTEHAKSLIAKKFNVTDIPDAFIFMPEQFGGLGLRNPFALLYMSRECLSKDPKEAMRIFFAEEKQKYKEAKKDFEDLGDQGRRRRFREVYPNDIEVDSIFADGDLNTFMTSEDFTRWRETANPLLLHAYQELMKVPEKRCIQYTLDVKDALEKLAVTQPELAPDKLDPELKWLVQFHSRELFERCGGLSIVNKSLLPLGILTMLKKRKVTWQMVL